MSLDTGLLHLGRGPEYVYVWAAGGMSGMWEGGLLRWAEVKHRWAVRHTGMVLQRKL